MIAAALQAAAEYVGVMIANGIRGAGRVAGSASDWVVAHPVEIVAALVGLLLLRALVRRSVTRR